MLVAPTKTPFIKITVAIPRLLAAVKRLLGGGEIPGVPACKAFESNIDFEIRFMADTNVVGCNWIELPTGKYRVRKEEKSRWCLLQNLFYRQPVDLIMSSLKSCDGIVEVLLCNVQSPLSFRTKTFQRVTNVLI